MNKKIEIEQYVPNQHLALKVVNYSENVRSMNFLYGSILFTATLFSFIFGTPLPFLFTAAFLFFFINSQPKPFLKRAVFTRKTLLLVYHTPLIEWTKEYELDTGIDWFVDLKSNPIEVQIGTNGKVLIDFELENAHDLPPLTDKISDLTRMDFDKNQKSNNYEVLRFRPQHQLESSNDYHFLKIDKNKDSIRIRNGMTSPFWIDLRNEVLYYKSWFSEIAMPLRFIGSIYCEIPKQLNQNLTAKWYFYDTQQQADILFFTLNAMQQDTDMSTDANYRALNFRNDNEQLKMLLKEIPALSNIEIRCEM